MINRLLPWIFIIFSNYALAENKAIEAFHKSQNANWDLIFTNPRKALPKLIDLKNQSYNYPDSMRAFAFNSLAVCHAVLGENFAAISMIDSALEISDTDKKRINLLLNKSMILIGIKSFQEAMAMLEKVKVLAQQEKDYQALQTAYEEMATIYAEFGHYEQSLDMLMKSKELNAKLPEIDLRAVIINKQKMGNLYLKTRDYPFAEKLIREASLEFKENNFLDAYYSSLIGYIDALNKLEQFQRADSLITAVLPEVENFGNAKLLAYYYTIYGNQLFGVGKLKEAKKYFERGYAVYTDSTFSEFPNKLFAQYLDFLQNSNQSQIAFELLNQHYDSFEKLRFSFEDRLYFHTVFYKIYKNLGLKDKAIKELVAKDLLRDSINTHRNFGSSRFSNSQYFLDYYEQIIQRKDHNIANLKILLSVTGGAFLLGILSISYLYLKIKNKQKSSQVIDQNLENEVELWKNKYKALLKLSSIQDGQNKTNKIKSEKVLTLHEVFGLLKENETLSEVHNKQIKDFYSTQYNHKIDLFRSLGKNLTKSEIFFCLFIEDGLKSKDIAKILNISAQSVATKKMRLSKKLGLESSSELKTFLSQTISNLSKAKVL